MFWEELLKQARTTKPLTISLPTVQALLYIDQTTAIHVINTISAPDVPKILHVDLNTVVFSTHLACSLTLLASAFLEREGALFDYYRGKNIPLVAVGSMNPLRVMLSQRRFKPQDFEDLLTIDPKLIMKGNSNGLIEEENGELLYQYQPICNMVNKYEFIDLFYKYGVSLTMANAEGISPLQHACKLRSVSLVQFLLSHIEGTIEDDVACVTALLREATDEVSGIITILKVQYIMLY